MVKSFPMIGLMVTVALVSSSDASGATCRTECKATQEGTCKKAVCFPPVIKDEPVCTVSCSDPICPGLDITCPAFSGCSGTCPTFNSGCQPAVCTKTCTPAVYTPGYCIEASCSNPVKKYECQGATYNNAINQSNVCTVSCDETCVTPEQAAPDCSCSACSTKSLGWYTNTKVTPSRQPGPIVNPVTGLPCYNPDEVIEGLGLTFNYVLITTVKPPFTSLVLNYVTAVTNMCAGACASPDVISAIEAARRAIAAAPNVNDCWYYNSKGENIKCLDTLDAGFNTLDSTHC